MNLLITFPAVRYEIFAPFFLFAIILRTSRGATVSGSFANILYILMIGPLLAGSFLMGPSVRSVRTIPGLIVPTITGPPFTSAAKASVKGKYNIYPEQAAAGLWTNPSDLSKYIIETVLSYNGKSDKVLTPEYTKLRLAPVMQDAAAGVFVDRKDSSFYFSHNGANEGFTCYYAGDVISGNGMVVMTNSSNGSLSSEVANSVATVYGWKDYYQPVLKTVVDVDEAVLERYIGKYEAGGDVFTIRREGRNLLISPYPGIWVNTYFTSDVDFFVWENEGDMKFVTDAEGKVTGFSINGMFIRKVE